MTRIKRDDRILTPQVLMRKIVEAIKSGQSAKSIAAKLGRTEKSIIITYNKQNQDNKLKLPKQAKPKLRPKPEQEQKPEQKPVYVKICRPPGCKACGDAIKEENRHKLLEKYNLKQAPEEYDYCFACANELFRGKTPIVRAELHSSGRGCPMEPNEFDISPWGENALKALEDDDFEE